MDMRLKRLARDRGLPKLIESLAMCYMAILLLRLPVTIGDLQTWIGKYEMPYFRVVSFQRAIKFYCL
jgi:RNA polymerase I-specific transcription initiation factor RRN7